MIEPQSDIIKLKNYIESLLFKLKGQNYWEYDEWELYYNPEYLAILADQLYARLQSSGIVFDHIGALGGSGTPIAIKLNDLYYDNKQLIKFIFISDPLIGISSKWVRVVKPNLKKDNRKILLIDTEIKSGRTICDGTRKILEKELGEIVGIAVITDYTGFPDRTDFQNTVVDKNIPVLKLFDFNPIKKDLQINNNR